MAQSLKLPLPKLAIIGEAWGRSEAEFSHAFVGASGQELALLLFAVGFTTASPFVWIAEKYKIFYGDADTFAPYMPAYWKEQSNVTLLNVFNEQPPKNNMRHFCATKKVTATAYPDFLEAYGKLEAPTFPWPKSYTFAKLPSGYIKPSRLLCLPQLRDTINALQPDLALCLGNTAIWALLGESGVGRLRGVVAWSTLCDNLKVIPTYHPAAVLREYSLRPIVQIDLQKAWREAHKKGIQRPPRRIIIRPALSDIRKFLARYRADAPRMASVDVETIHGQMTRVGFATSPQDAIVIPFWDITATDAEGNLDPHYWRTHADECKAWELVRQFLLVDRPLVGQNGLYDLQYLWGLMGFAAPHYEHDTMLMHHCLQPELPKGLGFLASVYTDEGSWKQLRSSRHKMDTEKRDE